MESTIVFVLVAVVVLGALLAYFLRKERTTVATHEVDENVGYDYEADEDGNVRDEDIEVVDLTKDRVSPLSEDVQVVAPVHNRVPRGAKRITPLSPSRKPYQAADTNNHATNVAYSTTGYYGLGYDHDLDGLPNSIDPVYGDNGERVSEPVDLTFQDQPITNAPVEPVVEAPSYSTPAYEAPSYTTPSYTSPSYDAPSSSYDSGSSSSYDSGSSSSSDSGSSSY